MKGLLCLLTLFTLAFLPCHAGVSVSVHVGGYGGGGHYGGGGRYYGGFHGYHGGFYGAYPYYSYPYYDGSYVDAMDYDDSSFYPPAYTPALAPPANSNTPPEAAAPSTPVPATSSGPLSMGKLDELGYIHSPYSTSTFKASNVINGQIFHDPITGQLFQVRLSPAQQAPATAPSGSIPAPTGKLDEFGYVHSPYSTFTFKVQDGNYARTFHDPFTGQPFKVTASEAPDVAVSLPTGKLDEFGYVHSPYSTFTFKVQDGNYAQTFYDPYTNQPFNVTASVAPQAVASAKATN